MTHPQPKEKARITKAGGFVIMKRVNGDLAVSRLALSLSFLCTLSIWRSPQRSRELLETLLSRKLWNYPQKNSRYIMHTYAFCIEVSVSGERFPGSAASQKGCG